MDVSVETFGGSRSRRTGLGQTWASLTRAAARAIIVAVIAALVVTGCSETARRPPQKGTAHEQEVARLLVGYLESRDAALLQAAREKLARETSEVSGPGHRNLLNHLTRYLATPEAERGAVSPTPLYQSVLEEIAAGDGAAAKRLLQVTFLGEPPRQGHKSDDSYTRVLAMCSYPDREQSEPPAAVSAFMGIRPGEAVADVGAGAGFFTFPFAAAVGDTGRVYAVELNERLISFLERYAASHGVNNLTVVRAARRDTKLPETTLDHAFMTHMFVDIEIYYSEDHRRALFGSVLRGLKPGGRFTVCEPAVNGRENLTTDEVVERLHAYGFRGDTRPEPGSPLTTMGCVQVARP